jgi:hypothetical protein
VVELALEQAQAAESRVGELQHQMSNLQQLMCGLKNDLEGAQQTQLEAELECSQLQQKYNQIHTRNLQLQTKRPQASLASIFGGQGPAIVSNLKPIDVYHCLQLGSGANAAKVKKALDRNPYVHAPDYYQKTQSRRKMKLRKTSLLVLYTSTYPSNAHAYTHITHKPWRSALI